MNWIVGSPNPKPIGNSVMKISQVNFYVILLVLFIL